MYQLFFVTKKLKKYKEVVKKLYEKAGWVEPPKKRVRDGPVYQHFDWLTLYQVKGLKMREIANFYEKKQMVKSF